MASKVAYEWWYTVWTADENGEADESKGDDLQFRNEFDGFGGVTNGMYIRCELVWNEIEKSGCIGQRLYAEINHDENSLPEFFEGSKVRIPKKFHTQVSKFLKKHGNKIFQVTKNWGNISK